MGSGPQQRENPWRRITQPWIAPSLARDADKRLRAELVLAFTAVIVVVGGLRILSLSVAGMKGQALVVGAALVLAIATARDIRRSGNLVAAGNVLTAIAFATGTVMVYRRGGIGAPVFIGLGIAPLFAMFVAGRRWGVIWCGAVLVELGVYWVGRPFGFDPADQLAGEGRFAMEALGIALFSVLVLALGLSFDWAKDSALKSAIRAERERLAAEEDLKMARADRMASVGQVAAGVAHEINNPLAYIAGNVEFLEQNLEGASGEELERLRPELLEAAAEARQGIRRVGLIVRDLKTFSRENVEALDVVDLNEVLRSALRISDNEIRHRARLETLFPEAPVHVLGNETRLVQVFLNLLVNAAQAIEPGAPDAHRVSVEVDVTDPKACTVVIRDTGCGMTPDVLERAMDPFFTTKPPGVGTGLGLSVCRSIVEQLRGTLSLSSEPNRGTVARVCFNRTTARPQRAVPDVPQRPESPKEPVRILIIDDDPMVVRAMERLLRGHDLTTTANGSDAISAIAAGAHFDLILCDLMMPGITGVDVYEQLAALGRGIEERIVFLTGGAYTDRTRDFLASVPNPCVEKPVSSKGLAAILAKGTRAALH